MTMENEVMNVANEVAEVVETTPVDIPAVVTEQPSFGVGDYVVAGLAGVGAGAILGGLIYGGYKLVKHIQKKKTEAILAEPTSEENPAPEDEDFEDFEEE